MPRDSAAVSEPVPDAWIVPLKVGGDVDDPVRLSEDHRPAPITRLAGRADAGAIARDEVSM
jgi:hypothetical protein